MWWRILLGPLALGVQTLAYVPISGVAPAPIRWGGTRVKALVLAPKASRGQTIDPHQPQPLTITKAKKLEGEIPYFTPRADNTIEMNGMDMCVEASGVDMRAAVRINRCTGGPAQQWTLFQMGDGQKQHIQLMGTNRCLDVHDKEEPLDGHLVELRECEKSSTEDWIFGLTEGGSSSVPLYSRVLRAVLYLSVIATLGGVSMLWWQRKRLVALDRNHLPFNIDQSGISLVSPRGLRCLDFEPLSLSRDASCKSVVPAVMTVTIPMTADIAPAPTTDWKERTLISKKNTLEYRRQRRGAYHPTTLTALFEYAITLLEFGYETEAVPLLNEGLQEIVIDLNKPDRLPTFSPLTLEKWSDFADKLAVYGRVAEAEQLREEVREFISIESEVYGEWNRNDDVRREHGATAVLTPQDVSVPPVGQYLEFAATGKKIAIAMFDFDQTLSTKHVFHTLSKYASSVKRRREMSALDPEFHKKPAACSPAGQLSRLYKESAEFNADWAFGGPERISAIRNMLQRLQNRGVKMMVCTLGFPAVARKLLADADLLRYFGWDESPQIVGVSSWAYERYQSEYDLDAEQEYRIKEPSNSLLKGSKVALLDDLLKKEGAQLGMDVPLWAGVLVEDDPLALKLANIHVCKDAQQGLMVKTTLETVNVRDREGMREHVEMRRLLSLADA